MALTVTGPVERTIQFLGDGDPEATVTSSGFDFVLWGTQRRPWRQMSVEISGDHDIGAAFCDALHVM